MAKEDLAETIQKALLRLEEGAERGGGSLAGRERAALERRQLAKVRILPQAHHFIPQAPFILHEDPKIAKKQLAFERKRLRVAREERWLDFGRTLVVDTVPGIVHEAGFIIGKLLEATGRFAQGMTENPDPVNYALAGGTALAILLWFSSSFPELARLLHLDRLYDHLNTDLPESVAKTLTGATPTGQYCYFSTTAKQPYCFDSKIERGLIAMTTQPGLSLQDSTFDNVNKRPSWKGPFTSPQAANDALAALKPPGGGEVVRTGQIAVWLVLYTS